MVVWVADIVWVAHLETSVLSIQHLTQAWQVFKCPSLLSEGPSPTKSQPPNPILTESCCQMCAPLSTRRQCVPNKGFVKAVQVVSVEENASPSPPKQLSLQEEGEKDEKEGEEEEERGEKEKKEGVGVGLGYH